MNKKDTDKELLLSDVPANSEVYIAELTGGRAFRSKVLSLGLNIGTKLKINKTTSSINGCIVIAVNHSKLAIGYGMASKIIVTFSPSHPN